ncbi:MAG: DNA starvation/stationary phase protection protein, partial [Cellulomonas sp.]|nr:DNA starvation/stationary phase protection protein [Cellulomonas sp.]
MARKQLPHYTVPTLTPEDGATVAAILQDRLNSLTDLHLTLKHIHWNVVGPHFISVHLMLDPQVDAVRAQADEVAERIATLGVSPVGTPGALVASRSWDDYSLGRAGAIEHLGALDRVYEGVISGHRKAAADTAKSAAGQAHDAAVAAQGFADQALEAAGHAVSAATGG